ncbi:response regulator [Wenxinia saemankumensis]|uniref:Response regulator receiver domain-containing protein n=1 Tax=Wenxinia saemankumensis TaxID=1447782 RepID=A0A1M6AED9_9RHOB|nr:response regulator [Wenxinia saemankumensis]SHI34573.1 Response regulator receiver domain-containing protein [Wenxinia saemankumensis]
MSELRRVLHVDDDEDIRVIAGMALETIGELEVCYCDSGPDALDKAVGFAPDLFLLDYMMPGMDGEETARRLHELPGLETVPVIYMTARVQGDVTRALLENGAIGVISKPFDPITLSEQLIRIWEDHRG